MSSPAVLVVDDERDMAESVAFFLRRAGIEATLAHSGHEALELLDRTHFALVVTDVKMPRMSGMSLLEQIKARDLDTEVVMITGFPEIGTAVHAIKQGAFDYLPKPFSEQELMQRVHKALAHNKVRAHNADLRERLRLGTSGRQFIYRSQIVQTMIGDLQRVAATNASVLIQGESGTGKELVAHFLHDNSSREGRPFVPVDCSAIPESLVESELFGHVRGAFSGAHADKVGLFLVADGGTLFLDEVGELPLMFQAKFLRAIQERQVRRVGASRYEAVDVRVVCATNRNLADEVRAGRFREDLFYRLDVVQIEVPPLRSRIEDVPLLVQYFLSDFIHRNPQCTPRSFSEAALARLMTHHWPGNVRQLRNVVERACALGRDRQIDIEDLPVEVGNVEVRAGEPAGEALSDRVETFQEMKQRNLAAIESSYLDELLRRHGGNVTRSALEAGMTRSALQKLMQRYGIKSSEFR